MQTIQPHMIERYHKNQHLIPSTVTVGEDLAVAVIEETHYADSWRAKNAKTEAREERKRTTTLEVKRGMVFHALIDEEEGEAMVFIPAGGWFETAMIPLQYIHERDDRKDEGINYREWGMNRTSVTKVTPMGRAEKVRPL